MRPDIEPVTRAGRPYYIGRVVDGTGKELARSPLVRSSLAQAMGDASALMRDWLRSRMRKQA